RRRVGQARTHRGLGRHAEVDFSEPTGMATVEALVPDLERPGHPERVANSMENLYEIYYSGDRDVFVCPTRPTSSPYAGRQELLQPVPRRISGRPELPGL